MGLRVSLNSAQHFRLTCTSDTCLPSSVVIAKHYRLAFCYPQRYRVRHPSVLAVLAMCLRLIGFSHAPSYGSIFRLPDLADTLWWCTHGTHTDTLQLMFSTSSFDYMYSTHTHGTHSSGTGFFIVVHDTELHTFTCTTQHTCRDTHWNSPGTTHYGTTSPSRPDALRFIDTAKSASTNTHGSLVNFRRRLAIRHGRPRRMLTIFIRRTPIGL